MSRCLRVTKLSLEREKNGFRFMLQVPSLEIFAGQTLAVVGQSGCGKSTLLDALSLILRPTRVAVFRMYTGKNVEIDLLRASPLALSRVRGKEIGYVLQSGGLLSFLSVRENILLPGRLLGLERTFLEKRLEALACQLNIETQLKKKPQHLSGGQRQRAAIARALIHTPRIVYADEPTAAVDQETAREIFAVFKKMVQNTQTALVVVSHDRDLVDRFADRTVSFSLRREPGRLCSTLIEEAGLAPRRAV